MDGKVGIFVFLGLVLVFACLAFGNLVEGPPALPEAPPPAIRCEWIAPRVPNSATNPVLPRSAAKPLSSAAENPLPLEKDQNGTPLSKESYRRAAYEKFPPEAFHG